MIGLVILASSQVFVVSTVSAAKFVISLRLSICLAASIITIFIGLQP
jgi:hypothetical protein